MSCPSNSFRYNGTLCACPPGHLFDLTTNSCGLFSSPSAIVMGRVESSAVSFPGTMFSFDSLRKLTQSQVVFLQATLVMLLSWLLFCLFLRFMKLGDGRSIWFRMRWWVTRLDLCFATTHWLVSCPRVSFFLHYFSDPFKIVSDFSFHMWNPSAAFATL